MLLNWCRLFVFFQRNIEQANLCLSGGRNAFRAAHAHKITVQPNQCGSHANRHNVTEKILSRIQCHVPNRICSLTLSFNFLRLFVLFVNIFDFFVQHFGWLCRPIQIIDRHRRCYPWRHFKTRQYEWKKQNARVFMKNVPQYCCLLSRQSFGDGLWFGDKNSIC